MFFSVTPVGPWDRINQLRRFWPQRAEAVQRRIVLDFVKQFRKLTISRIPKESKYSAYRKSLVTRKLNGSFTKGEFGYALIADPKPILLEEINDKENVVFVVPTGDGADALGTLLADTSPWPIDMLPQNLEQISGIKLVHREATAEEIDKIRALRKDTLSKYGQDFKTAKAKFKPSHEPKKPKSMPAVIFMALRMEFGIYSTHKPHWGYAARQQMAIMKEMADDNVYSRYLGDVRFTQWQKQPKKLKPMPVQMFKTLYLKFQDKIASK